MCVHCFEFEFHYYCYYYFFLFFYLIFIYVKEVALLDKTSMAVQPCPIDWTCILRSTKHTETKQAPLKLMMCSPQIQSTFGIIGK